jgi:hypothetical protein
MGETSARTITVLFSDIEASRAVEEDGRVGARG